MEKRGLEESTRKKKTIAKHKQLAKSLELLGFQNQL